MILNVDILNPAICRMKRSSYLLIAKAFEYDVRTYSRYTKKYQIKKQYAIINADKTHVYFYTGLIPYINRRIKPFLIELLPDTIQEKFTTIDPCFNKVLRQDQIELLWKIRENQRGIIQSPTRTGKTVIMGAMLHSFNQPKTLILMHLKDLVEQTSNALEEMEIENIQKIMGNIKERNIKGNVVVATIQTMSKLEYEGYEKIFKCVIVDEAHHITSFEGNYSKVLSHCEAPIRIGFTATVPKVAEKFLPLYSMLGEVIGKLSIKDAVDLEILAKPTIQMIQTNFRQVKSDIGYDWNDIYESEIINHFERNNLICKIANNQPGLTLIVVTSIQHGLNLQEIFDKQYHKKISFVQGETELDKRLEVKDNLQKGLERIVICTTVWKEGVNIPNLDTVINAAGGRSEIATLQGLGRPLTKTVNKKTALLIDFFDNHHKFLRAQAIARTKIYQDAEWRIEMKARF